MILKDIAELISGNVVSFGEAPIFFTLAVFLIVFILGVPIYVSARGKYSGKRVRWLGVLLILMAPIGIAQISVAGIGGVGGVRLGLFGVTILGSLVTLAVVEVIGVMLLGKAADSG